MDLEKRVHILEIAYAGLQVDAVKCFDREGILDKVTESKRNEQMRMGKLQAERFGIQTTQEVFLKLSELFECSMWSIQEKENGFVAESKACKLCAIAKKSGSASPCYMYCLNPMEGMVKGINQNSTYDVKETLWDGQKCKVEVTE